MKRTSIISAVIFQLLILCLACAQDFKIDKISGKVFIVADPDGGESQLVVKSQKGLVVFDSFWSEIPAGKYKNEIVRALKRDDFNCMVNMVDRLDMFGGNASYKGINIIGHDTFLDKYTGREKEVEAEIKQLIEMWRWKEEVSRERLKTHEKGSEEALGEEQWMNTCRQRADELETGYSLVLPNLYYHDRMTLNLGDITLNLIWFGKAGNYKGMTVAVIPEEKLAVIPGFIMHSQHLAPHPHDAYAELDVDRWISVMEELFEGEDKVEKVICSNNDVWSVNRAHEHLHYIRELWKDIKIAEAQGNSLDEIQDRFSLDNEFAFVKNMQVYKDGGDQWIRPQHRSHVRVFFLQHKNLASEIIKKEGTASFAKLREMRSRGDDIYFDEASINGIGYYFMSAGEIYKAVEVFSLNAEIFPKSANVYDSLGEAYMKSGNKELAVENYRKSLELNPENNNAVEMLKKLENM